MSKPASDATRSVGSTTYLDAWPAAERAPRMHCIEERRRAKESLHLSQARVELYGCSHFSESSEASLLKQTVAAGPAPPVRDMTRGVQ